MAVVGWLGFGWIVLNAALSLRGLYRTHKRRYAGLILSKSAALRSYTVIGISALAILAVALFSDMTGTLDLSVLAWGVVSVSIIPLYLAIVAWVLLVPFLLDTRKASKDVLVTSTTHVVLRALLVVMQLALVSLMMFA